MTPGKWHPEGDPPELRFRHLIARGKQLGMSTRQAKELERQFKRELRIARLEKAVATFAILAIAMFFLAVGMMCWSWRDGILTAGYRERVESGEWERLQDEAAERVEGR